MVKGQWSNVRWLQFGIVFTLAVSGIGVVWSTAHAVGLAIQPARLTVAAPWGGEGFGTVLVSNATAEPAMYALGVEGTPTQVEVAPAGFRLDPGASQAVTVRYQPRGFPARRGQINIVARPLGGGTVVASGVRYRVNLAPLVPWLAIVSRGILLGAVVAVAMWASRRPGRTQAAT